MYAVIYKFLPSANVSPGKSAFVGSAHLPRHRLGGRQKRHWPITCCTRTKSLYGELGGLIIFVLLVSTTR